MSEFLSKLFSSDFMPHGACYLWRPEIVWLHATSDTLIALSYYLIPIVLIYFVRKRTDLPFNWIFMMFGVFILACGTTHVMEVWTLWICVPALRSHQGIHRGGINRDGGDAGEDDSPGAGVSQPDTASDG